MTSRLMRLALIALCRRYCTCSVRMEASLQWYAAASLAPLADRQAALRRRMAVSIRSSATACASLQVRRMAACWLGPSVRQRAACSATRRSALIEAMRSWLGWIIKVS